MTIKLSSPCILLLALFVALKLTGVVTWSWWAVFAPVWVPVVLVIALALTIIVVTLAIAAVFVTYVLWKDAP